MKENLGIAVVFAIIVVISVFWLSELIKYNPAIY